MFIFNLFRAAYCSELQFLVCLKIFNFESTKVAICLDGLCQKTEKNERRKKENENDYGTPIVAIFNNSIYIQFSIYIYVIFIFIFSI